MGGLDSRHFPQVFRDGKTLRTGWMDGWMDGWIDGWICMRGK